MRGVFQPIRICGLLKIVNEVEFDDPLMAKHVDWKKANNYQVIKHLCRIFPHSKLCCAITKSKAIFGSVWEFQLDWNKKFFHSNYIYIGPISTLLHV